MEMELQSLELSWAIVVGSLRVCGINFLLKAVRRIVIVNGGVADIIVVVVLLQVVQSIKVIWLNVYLRCMTVEETCYVTHIVVFLNHLILVSFDLWVQRVPWRFGCHQINW